MAKKELPTKEFKYISFECCLIHHIKKEIGSILSYGIVKFALNLTGDDYKVIREAIELYFDKKLPPALNTVFTKAGIPTNDRSFNSLNKHDISNIYDSLTNYLSSEATMNVKQFVDSSRLYYQINQALKTLGLSVAVFTGLLENYRKLNALVSDHEQRHGKDAMVSIKIDTIIDFRNNDKDNREFELLKGYLAIKSIQGQKDFAGTNKTFITARMIGAKNVSIADVMIKDKAIKKLYSRFNERYFFDKLLLELQAKSFIKSKITYNRKIYLSTQIDGTLLAAAIANNIENKQLNQISKQFKENEKNLKNSITNLLNNR